ncbi:hypothetical protein PV11_08675 [Exophiala sideris]|uniref:Alpha/beta hydrolase fold-3 domain-containing protein n=1 Tax=Exophiala sideris TaxID=1016849 RepID=A0A0D1Y7H2_9EURO|nr:hypothetical protein PV11_08675 [Exophiala sideris]
MTLTAQPQILSDPEQVPKFGNDIATLRRQLQEVKASARPAHDPYEALVRVEELSVRARDGHSLGMRLYTPVSSAPPTSQDQTRFPVIVWFHGGGFCLGDLDTGDAVCRRLSAEMPSVVVSVDFRLAPEYPVPTPVNDAWDAVQWVAHNYTSMPQAELSKGFIVAGIFTGANLAAVVSHQARDRRLTPPLTGVFLEMPALLNPRSVFETHAAPAELLSYAQNVHDPIVRPDLLSLFWGENNPLFNCIQSSPVLQLYCYVPDKAAAENHLASPLLWPNGHHGLPPTCLQVCGADPLRDEALVYDRELRERYGVVTRLYFYPGMPHGFATYFSQAKLAGEYSEDFLSGFRWLLVGSTRS